MTPQVLSHLFEPFFTTKDIGKGTGLGLATVYGIAKQHSGWVEVSTQVGTGTEFKVYLPAAPRSAVKAESPSRSAATAPGKETILLVEDEEPVRVLTCLLLRRNGYRVIEADCGASALAIWKEKSPQIDMVLTDMIMPGGISGRELADRLRHARPDLKVVYMSGYSPSRAGQDPKILEGLRFIPKPYTAAKLLQTIQDCLAN